MQLEECTVRRAEAANEFDTTFQREDGAHVTNSLAYGLTTLRNLLYTRVHDDVESTFGVDSMLLPVSKDQSERITKTEIELYQLVISADEVKQRGYLDASENWYLPWLGKLRCGDAIEKQRIQHRLNGYLELESDERRLLFSRVLQKSLPETAKAPLILFRLFPLAVRIATVVAFGDHLSASELRNKQLRWQAAIADCLECHSRVLDNGERCPTCSNPLWTYVWLTVTD